MNIISRAQWGARAWNGQPYSTPLSSRTHFLVHYHGGPPPNATGKWVPKNVENIHLGNGWSGVGYNFLVDQDGRIYEGRGWNLVGAHCPGKNRTGIGVYVAVGGSQEPTDAAKAAVVWIYGEANRRTGRTLTVGVHGDWYSTQCAGPKLTPWAHGGMLLERGGGAQSVEFEVPVVAPIPDSITEPGKIAEDGLLGPATYRALQQVVGVKADGIWGPATRRALQKYLRVKVDGIVGTGTVKALQRAVGADVDGIWGRGTTLALQRALNRDDFDRPKRKAKGKAERKPTRSRLAVDGLRGPATTKALQEWVGAPVDGALGPVTVRHLQRKLGVPADSILGPVTVKALQRKVGTTVDGAWGSGTTAALQRFLNGQR